MRALHLTCLMLGAIVIMTGCGDDLQLKDPPAPGAGGKTAGAAGTELPVDPGMIRGRLLVDEGFPVKRLKLLTRGAGVEHHLSLADDGTFQSRRPQEPGSWMVVVWHREEILATVRDIELPDGGADERINPLDLRGKLAWFLQTVEIVDAEGNPVSEVQVDGHPIWETAWWLPEQNHGRLELFDVRLSKPGEPAGLDLEPFDLTVMAPGFRTTTVPGVDGDRRVVLERE